MPGERADAAMGEVSAVLGECRVVFGELDVEAGEKGEGGGLGSRIRARCWRRWRWMRKMMSARRRRSAAEPIAIPIIIGVLRGPDVAGRGDKVPGFKMSTMLVFPGLAGWRAW